MEHDVIFSSEYILITKRTEGFYIESFRSGMSIEQFNKVMSEHTEIKITNFMVIKNALLYAPCHPEKFGQAKERVSVEISSDELRAYITLCVLEGELSEGNRTNLVKEIMNVLADKGVVFGVKPDAILLGLENNRQFLAAEGIPPEHGNNSGIKMYELKEAKPEIKEDGNVDHYELKLINKVKVGEWLGERIDATDGVAGRSVTGRAIPPIPGKTLPLLYDRTSVKEVYSAGVTTLYSLRDGAVSYHGDRITVSNHLEIGESIDFKTGNIDFDGFLTVKGTIGDNFSVAAREDIEILGDYGVGSVKEIISRQGSIYIKGGIAGRNKATIKSKKDIYTKYVSDATIYCEGRVHIGFYCLNSNIIAKEVILDSPKGQIIGGNIEAEIKVVASIIGSPSEKRTYVSVKGFNRQEMKDKLEKLVRDSEIVKANLNRVKQEIANYSGPQRLEPKQSEQFERVKELFIKLKDQLREMEDEKRSLVSYLRTRGEGEVSILKKAFPGTVLELKKHVKEVNKVILTTTYYINDREIKAL